MVLEPTTNQLRTAAAALMTVALVTAAMISLAWADWLDGPLLLPLVAGYFLFNIGYVISLVRTGLRTKGLRMGFNALALNFAAMLLSGFLWVWTALSALAVGTALAGAYLLFREARSST